jgi:hypothetical protein
LAQGQISRAAAEQRQPVVQTFQERHGRQRFHPRGGQFDREREAVDPVHDLGNHRQRLGGETELGSDGLRALDEQPHRARHPGILSRGRGVQRQWSNGELALAGDPESCAAGDQERHAGAETQEIAHLRPRGDHLLEVIQDQELVGVGQNADQAVMQQSGAHVAQSQYSGDGVQDESGIGNRGEVDEGDAVGKGIADIAGGRKRQAGLADAARPGQGQQANIGIAHQRDNGGQLSIARNQWRERQREGRAHSGCPGDGRPERQGPIVQFRRLAVGHQMTAALMIG